MTTLPPASLDHLTNPTVYFSSRIGTAYVVLLDKSIFELKADGTVTPSDLEGLTAFMHDAMSDRDYTAFELKDPAPPFPKAAESVRFMFVTFALIPLFNKTVDKRLPLEERLEALERLQPHIESDVVLDALVAYIIDADETPEDDANRDLDNIPLGGRFGLLMSKLVYKAAGMPD